MFLLTARDTVMMNRGGTCSSAQQIHTAHGSMGGVLCNLSQSYFLVLTLETLDHILMGESIVANVVCSAAWLLVKTSFVGDNLSQQKDFTFDAEN